MSIMSNTPRNNRRFVAIVVGSYALLYAAALLARHEGIAINHTTSAPRGLWRVYPLSGPVERGQMVSFCPPDDAWFRRAREQGRLDYGRCLGGYEPMLKTVRAISGDVVTVTADGVAVNGQLLANSAALARDGAGREMDVTPHGTYAVANGEVWVFSAYTPRSFDSRYFGPVATAQIEGEAKPLWTE
jgi:conjugative transfer signal peptidase TraF